MNPKEAKRQLEEQERLDRERIARESAPPDRFWVYTDYIGKGDEIEKASIVYPSWAPDKRTITECVPLRDVLKKFVPICRELENLGPGVTPLLTHSFMKAIEEFAVFCKPRKL